MGRDLPGLGAGGGCSGGRGVSGPVLGRYGHVPNGARVYYLQRSQPPLLSLMMERYVTQANDTAFLRWPPRPLLPSPPFLRLPGAGRGGG